MEHGLDLAGGIDGARCGWGWLVSDLPCLLTTLGTPNSKSLDMVRISSLGLEKSGGGYDEIRMGGEQARMAHPKFASNLTTAEHCWSCSCGGG
jgi:hypothetical protein